LTRAGTGAIIKRSFFGRHAMRDISLSLLLVCGACASPASIPQSGAASETLTQIRKMVGAASCARSAECQSLALGAKSCGGPEFFLAWSNRQTALPPLHALAVRYRQERMAANAQSAIVSDCRMLDDPGASCQMSAPGGAGQCVLRAAVPRDPR
jgi:hypothetical protein